MPIQLTWLDLTKYAADAASRIIAASRIMANENDATRTRILAYPVPRGGIHAAQAIKAEMAAMDGPELVLTDSLPIADIIIDDLIDSGKTKDRITKQYNKPFITLIDKRNFSHDNWIEFPWERAQSETPAADSIVRLLQYIGENPQREGLLETPARVIKAYDEMFSGYKTDPKSIIKVFEEDSCDEMVLLRNIEFYSVCEHHMLPFFGTAHVAYIPNGKIVGLSKLARLVDIFSRRLQVQERLTTQITETLDELLQPAGSACVMEAQHFCMLCRGVRKQNSSMVTSSLTGAFRQPAVRAEFFSMVNHG